MNGFFYATFIIHSNLPVKDQNILVSVVFWKHIYLTKKTWEIFSPKLLVVLPLTHLDKWYRREST